MTKFIKITAIGFIATISFTAIAYADVPVIDSAVLSQTRQITQNTKDILNTDKEIKATTDKILEAVTGNRTDGDSAKGAALGTGFNAGKAPNFGDVLKGGNMDFGQLGGDFQQVAAKLINGLKLVKQLGSLIEGGAKTSNQQGYESLINTTSALAGIISGSQSAVTERSSKLQEVETKIGQAKDIKGAVAMNSMVSVQTGQTINEAVGMINSLNAAEEAKLLKRLAEESGAAQLLEYEK